MEEYYFGSSTHTDGLRRSPDPPYSEAFKAAVEDLERALQLEPGHKNAGNYLETTHLRYAAKLRQQGRVVEAAGEYMRAAGLRGEKQAEALAGLQQLQQLLERKAAAEQMAQASAMAAFGGGSALGGGVRGGGGLSGAEQRCLEQIRRLRSGGDGGTPAGEEGEREEAPRRHSLRRESRESGRNEYRDRDRDHRDRKKKKKRKERDKKKRKKEKDKKRRKRKKDEDRRGSESGSSGSGSGSESEGEGSSGGGHGKRRRRDSA